MNTEIWHRLLMLQSHDVVVRTYFKIHGRKLNARRSKEINAAARQAQEFFRNAASADFSVKPLLTFYGVTSLSRSLLLILRTENGEEGLTPGHGLATVKWRQLLSNSGTSRQLPLDSLTVRTCNGLFTDLIRETQNLICIHVNSAAVQGHIPYNIPPLSLEVSLIELLERIPDFRTEAEELGIKPRYSSVQSMTFSKESGIRAQFDATDFEIFSKSYEDAGYVITTSGKIATLTGTSEILQKEAPQLIHAYIHKSFGFIPNLYITDYFKSRVCLSQIGVLYLMSYFLGMLCRYFPTRWMSLIQGGEGDAYWPILHRAQHCVEQTFPELVIDLLQHLLKQRNN